MMQPTDDTGPPPRAGHLGFNPLYRAYRPKCEAVKVHCTHAEEQRRRRLALFAHGPGGWRSAPTSAFCAGFGLTFPGLVICAVTLRWGEPLAPA